MNDSLRTDVFVRYPPETIAAACIYLSARKLKVPLPRNPSWFDVLAVIEDDIKDCCYRIMCLYVRKKPNHDELERKVDALRQRMEENKKMRSGLSSSVHTPSHSSPASRTGSPTPNLNQPSIPQNERARDHRGDKDARDQTKQRGELTREGHQMNANSFGGERRSGGNGRHSSNHHDNRKSYQNRFQSMSGGAAVGSTVIGAGVNDENTNDRNTAYPRDQRRSSGIDRDNRNRDGANPKASAEHHGSGGDFDQDGARKHKKHKRSRSHSGGDGGGHKDHKKNKRRHGRRESPDEEFSPSKKSKGQRDKSRYEDRDRGHHPDYYDRRLGKDQIERGVNNSHNQQEVKDGSIDEPVRGSQYSSSGANDSSTTGGYNNYDHEHHRRESSRPYKSEQRNSGGYNSKGGRGENYRR